MADVTIGELPSLNTMEADTLIPVEHDGEAKSMSGTVLGNYVYGLVEDDVEIIAEIIAIGPPGISPTLSSSKTGKTTTIYYTDADHPTSTVLATLQDGADGTGVGDMLKSTYDADNDGVVDDSEKLGGQLPSYYMTASLKGAANGVAELDADQKVAASQATAAMVNISSNTTLSSSHNGKRLKVTSSATITVPSTLSAGFECEIVHCMSSGTVTIATSGTTLNGNSSSVTMSEKYDVAVLAALTATDWMIKGDAE